MPTYDYQCSTCGTAFELFQSFNDDTLKRCPTKKSGDSPMGCTSPGRGRVEKVFSAPGISFKGSGFYKNDSRSSSSSSSSAESSSGFEPKSSEGDSSKSSSSSSDGSKSDSSKSSPSKKEPSTGDKKSSSSSS